MGEIRFGVLGPVQATEGERRLPLPGERQRALLSLLLLAAGRPVRADRLAEELWHGNPPQGAQTSLRSYVTRLRRALGGYALIERTADGYTLQIDRDQVDSFEFERLTREGEEALSRGAAKRARDLLSDALSLWRGPAFGELGSEGALRAEADRLEELRLFALEQRVEAELALGRSAELIDELEQLTRDHPKRERFWRQLMIALYRAGRQAEALTAYRRARTFLHEELGLEPGEELRELEQAVLRQEIETVAPPEERHNLPADLSSFVGREHELAELGRLLGSTRLLTLTGVGGAGKTRLALESARQALADFPDGVFFCDLAPLTEEQFVAGRVARVLDVREQGDAPVSERLVARLRESDLLLVLDNCEHVRAAAAELAHRLLSRCPRVKVLATSREPLAVDGEVDFPVPPLSLARPDADLEELEASEAVRLFVARAREARPRLKEDADTLRRAAAIASDLDGLPLALELAAARAKALSLDEIATHLADRFRFLVSWRRVTAARHRTLRATMDWSYELLAPDERMLLARLSVFSGSFTVDAVAEVCLEEDHGRALELVERLVVASLVVTDERDGETRYRLLETVRQYGAERLEEHGETNAARARHAEYFARALEALWDRQRTDFDEWVRSIDPIYDDVRGALVSSADAEDAVNLIRIAKAVWRFWWVRGELTEGRRWLELAIERGSSLEPELRAEAFEGAAGLAWASGDLVRADELARAAESLFAAIGDIRGEAAALNIQGLVAVDRHEPARARRALERSRELHEQIGFMGDVAVVVHNLASLSLAEGDLDEAEKGYQAALANYESESIPWGVALCELYLGIVAIERGRHEEAAGYLRRALAVYREMQFLQYSVQCLQGIAIVVHARGDAAEAVRLLAAAEQMRDRLGDVPGGITLRSREATLAAARTELGEAGMEALWAEGRMLTEQELFDRAERAVSG